MRYERYLWINEATSVFLIKECNVTYSWVLSCRAEIKHNVVNQVCFIYFY